MSGQSENNGEGGLLRPGRRVPMEGVTRVRVRYSECDPMGVAHHAAYALWLEIARTEMLRSAGVTYAAMEGAGVYLVVAQMNLAYRRPVFYDDVVEVRTRVVGGSRVKIEHRYELFITEDGGHGSPRPPRPADDVVTSATTTLVCVTRGGRVRPLPEWLMPVTTAEEV